MSSRRYESDVKFYFDILMTSSHAEASGITNVINAQSSMLNDQWSKAAGTIHLDFCFDAKTVISLYMEMLSL